MEKDRKTIIEDLQKTIDGFYKDYKLPPQNISERDWNIYLDVVEEYLQKKDKMNEYIHALNILIRRALFFAQVSNDKEFTIKHLDKALCDLSVFNIYHDEREMMHREIDKKINEISYEEELKDVLYQAIDDEVRDHPNLPDYEINTGRIPMDDYFKLFSVLEAHYLANNMMDRYLDDMYYYVQGIAYNSWVCRNEQKTIADIMIDVVKAGNSTQRFDNDELKAISSEIKEKIDGRDISEQESNNCPKRLFKKRNKAR